MKKNNDINSLREKIDQIDEKLMQLIGKRGDYAKKIGSIKQGHGKKIYVPSREREIFKRLSKLNNGPYSDTALFQIFRELISATRALEQPIRVAFLGPEATFTHKAAVSHFGQSAEFHATDDIASVFQDVAKGQADFGVVPIENSTEGVVNYTLGR
ncbi:MAG: chorismate mutase [Deltaproteobacteria bacterium]|nr:chorismate mutase [Deltaproteobacteria bacterium]